MHNMNIFISVILLTVIASSFSGFGIAFSADARLTTVRQDVPSPSPSPSVCIQDPTPPTCEDDPDISADECDWVPEDPILPTPTMISSDGQVLHVDLVISETVVCIAHRKYMRTRAINGMVPGPTIRIKPGQTLKVRLINKLSEDCRREEKSNSLTFNQQTNIHLHGLHIDGDWPSDSVTRVVYPGQTAYYHAKITPDHLPGTHWLHPHRHGSTTLQVAGGAASAVIIEDLEPTRKNGSSNGRN